MELIFPPLSNISQHKRASVRFKYSEVPPPSGGNCVLPSFSDAELPALLPVPEVLWGISFFPWVGQPIMPHPFNFMKQETLTESNVSFFQKITKNMRHLAGTDFSIPTQKLRNLSVFK